MRATLTAAAWALAAVMGTCGVAASAGTVEQQKIMGPPASTSTGEWLPRSVSVYLPDGYAQRDQRYPTAYLIHGYEGDNTSFLGGTRYGGLFGEPLLPTFSMATEADRLIAEGAIPPMIIVFPDVDRLYPIDFIPVRYFATIVAFADSAYRTLQDRDARAIAGHSLGGYDAIVTALAYPELFSTVGLLAPYGITASSYELQPVTCGGTVPLRFWTYVGANDKHMADTNTTLPEAVRALVGAFAEHRATQVFVQDDGDHNAHIRERLDDFLVYAGQFLAVQPRACSATPDTVTAGSVVEHFSATVQLPAPGSSATFGQVTADLSGVGGSGAAELLSEGEDAYKLGHVSVTIPGPNGHLGIPLLNERSPSLGPWSFITLVVWPAGDQYLFRDGPGPGWTWRTVGSGFSLDTLATAATYRESRSALGVQASGIWQLFWDATAPVNTTGYDSLSLAVLPGEAKPKSWEVKVNSNKRRNLLKLVDWTDKNWQQVAICLDSLLLQPSETITMISIQGNVKGSFLLDDVRLTSPPLPPQAADTSGTAVVEAYACTVPGRFALEQNHPNPFNSSTVIRFALPNREPVELGVYNLAGQRVAILARGSREPGAYAVTWDGTDAQGHALASGLYVCRLQAGARVEGRKLLLVR